MNTDGGANPPPPSNSASSPISDQTSQKRAKKSASYSEYSSKPPQPPPLQHAQHASPERSSPYASVQSPYHFNSGPSLNTTASSQRSSPPPHASTPYGSGSRDPFGAPAYGSHPQQHPSAPLVSPYTPQATSAGPHHSEQQTYFAQQRSQQRSQSLQSVVTNPRGPPESFRSPPAASQPLPQKFSPSAHQSVPGTPLGPPPAFVSRQSPSTIRPPSSGLDLHDSPRNPLSSPRLTQENLRRDHIQAPPLVTQTQFSPQSSRPSETTPHPSSALKQDSLESASPHTASRHNSIAAISDPVPPGSIRSYEDRVFVESPTTQKPSAAGSEFSTSPIVPASQVNSSPSTATARGGAHPLKMEVDHQPQFEAQQPRQKRRRYNEPPIFAQRTARTKGRCPIIPNPLPPIPKDARQDQLASWAGAARRRSSSTLAAAPVAKINRPPAGPPAVPSPRTSVPPVLTPSAPQTTGAQASGPLGPWEPSITGVIPYEELTRTLGDFLFKHVVMRNDVNAGDAGSVGQGTMVEIEAKLGHVIDMDSRDRIQLPVLTESVINKENGRFRTSFESKMTVVSLKSRGPQCLYYC